MAKGRPTRKEKAFVWLDDETVTGAPLNVETHHKMAPKKKKALQLSKLYSFACGISRAPDSDIHDTECQGFARVVHCNHPELSPAYRSNYVSTTKYNIFTFVPKSLFEQFRRVANIYFLFAAACSLTPIAPFSSASLILPLVFVVGVSMVKEAMEDWRRFLQVSMESIARQIHDWKRQTEQKENKDAAYSLIIDGKALTYALEKDLKDKLLELAVQCASVICCRVSPKQKALITRLVKEGTGKTTLGIGDGANDVGMIQEADIGIGISGVEGMQATMASDFSIAQFRFLEQLLLVHGSWCYKRLALMICYFFYKNISFGLTLFYYEAYTVFSGQPAYNDWYMSLFNCIFTSLPVIALGIFEQDLAADVKLQFPALYQQGAQNKLFGWDRILGWISNAFCSSLIIFFFVSSILRHQAFLKSGQLSGMDVLGATMYTCVIFTVSCQIALAMSYFTWIQHILIFGSILAWYIFLLLYGYISLTISPSAYKVFIEACAPSAVYWITIILVVLTAIIPYFTCLVFRNYLFPMDHIIIHEKINLERDRNWLNKERKRAVRKTSVGFTARVEAKLKQWREYLQHHHNCPPVSDQGHCDRVTSERIRRLNAQ